MTLLLPLLLGVLSLAQADSESEPPVVSVARDRDPVLIEEVRRVAARVEQLRGDEFVAPPLAVRAPDSLRAAAAMIRANNVLPRARLESRGRAWESIGLGRADGPRELLEMLATDLVGIGFDPQGNRLLVAPERLKAEDFEPTDDPKDPATVLLITGVRPDEPLLAHMLMHVRQRERRKGDFLEETTDAMLARAAWAEGEANFVALEYLFVGMGIGSTVVEHRVFPGEVLDGSLLPPGIEGLSGINRKLASFVYLDGFETVVSVHRAGGPAAVDRAMAGVPTASGVLHPDRPVGVRAAWPEPANPTDSMSLVDTDMLGEQSVIALVSYWTGKDNLALIAGDGWVDDRLYRWEPPAPADPARGVTEWITRWADSRAATDFVYAMERVLDQRFPDSLGKSPAGSARVVAFEGRVLRMTGEGKEVRLRVAPAERDTVLESAAPTEAPSR